MNKTARGCSMKYSLVKGFKKRIFESKIFQLLVFLMLSASLSIEAAILSGQVKDQQGNPIEGANVLLFEYQGLNLVQVGSLVTVGEDGRYSWDVDDGDFVITSYFYGTDVELVGEPHIATVNSQDFNVVGDTTFDIVYNFVLLTGTVVDANGLPIAGVDFNTSKQWEGPEQGSRAKETLRSVIHQNDSSLSDADGSFSLLVFSTDDCIASDHFTDPNDCLYDITITPPSQSGFEATDILNYSINDGQSLTIELDFGDQIVPKIVAGPWVTNVSQTTVVVEWQTDEPTTATVNLDDIGGYNSPKLSRSHRVVLNQLTASTAYTGTIVSTDSAGNVSNSANISFSTLAESDSQAPWFTQQLSIKQLGATSATIEFCANEVVTATLDIGETNVVLDDLLICHEHELTGLTANTYYEVNAQITDTSGNGPINALPFEFTTASLDDDEAPVIIQAPIVTDISDTSVKISWVTNEVSTSGISINDGTVYRVLTDESLVTEHSLIVSGLTADTAYEFQVSSDDSLGNGPTHSEVSSFKTLAEPDQNAPIILGRASLQALSDSSAIIKWQTDESSSSVVRYGTSDAELNRVATQSGFVDSHQVLISDLAQNTIYYFQVESTDLSGNSVFGQIQTFQTRSSDELPPENNILGMIIDRITHQSVTVSWNTNLVSDSRIVCESLDATYEANKVETTTNHRISLTGLTANTRYWCTLYSVDIYQLVAIKVFSFSTLDGSDITAPSCQAPTITSFGTYSELLWQADELAAVSVAYREYEEGVNEDAEWIFKTDFNFSQNGLLVLTQLQANTNYQYQLTLTDLSGNVADCEVGEFNSGDGEPPLVNFTIQPQVDEIEYYSARVTWQTDIVSIGQVKIGTAENDLSLAESSNEFGLDHQVRLSDLEADTTYYLVVDAYNTNGDLTTSDTVSFTTPALPQAVSIIDGPRVVKITQTSAVVEWQTDKQANSYVSIAGVAEFSSDKLTLSHSVYVSGLTASTDYTATATSTDELGLTSDPASVNFTTLDIPDVDAPKFIEGPQVVSVSHDQVIISFCADEAVKGETTLDGKVYPLSDFKACHEQTIKGLSAGLEYTFSCSISDGDGNGPTTSENISFTTESDLDVTAPEIISGPQIIEISETTAIVIWTTNEKSNSFVALTDGENEFEFSDSELVTEHQVLLTGLTPLTEYFLTASSTDALGNGPTVSPEVSFITLGLPDTTAPEILSGPFVVDITSDSAIVVWETDEASTSLVEYGVLDSDLNLIATADSFVESHLVPLTQLSPETLYYLQVTSADVAGNSVTSEIISFTTLALEGSGGGEVVLLEITDGPNVIHATNDSLTIEWTTNLFADSRLVCVSEEGSVESSSADYKIEHQLTVNDLPSNTQFDCEVTSKTLSGDSASASLRVSTDTVADLIVPYCSGEIEIIGFGDSAQISWTASEVVNATFNYRFVDASDWQVSADTQFVEQSSQLIDELTPDSSYELQIILTDLAANIGECETITFDSGSLEEVEAPEFTVQPTVIDITENSAKVIWETQVVTTGEIRYGESSDALNQSAIDNNLTQSHSVTLTQLESGQVYYLEVDAFNINGVMATSDLVSFETLHPNNDFDDDGVPNNEDDDPFVPDDEDDDGSGDGGSGDGGSGDGGSGDGGSGDGGSGDGGSGDGGSGDDNSTPPQNFGPKLYGLVTGEGAPLPNALVSLYNNQQQLLESQLTLSDGSYSFEYLSPATYYVGVTPPANSEFSATPIQPIVVSDSDVVHWITLIGDAVTLSGYLKDNAGRVIDNTWVSLHLQTNANQVGNAVLTNNEGYFEFSVAPGTYQLRPLINVFGLQNGEQQTLPTYPVPDFAAVVYEPKNVTVEDDLQIDLIMPMAILSGTVEDSTGNPLANASINIDHQYDSGNETYYLQSYGENNGSRAITDESGNFQIALFVNQAIDLVITPPESRTDLATTSFSSVMISADSTQTFALVEGVSLSGKLTDALGRNIDHTKLTLHDQNTGMQIGHAVYTDSIGDYVFKVEAGDYKVQPHLNPLGKSLTGGNAPTYPSPEFASVRYAEENINVIGDTTLDIQLPLAILTGKTVDSAGNPISGVSIKISHIEHEGIAPNRTDYFLESDGSSSNTFAKSDANGDFTLALFIDQAFDIQLIPPFENRDFGSTLVADYSITTDTSDEFVIGEALTLSGYLRDSQGRVVDNTMLTLHDKTNHKAVDQPVFTNNLGYFEFKVGAGDYKIRPYLQATQSINSVEVSPNYLVPDFAAVYYLPDDISLSSDQEIEVTLPMSLLTGKALDINGVAVPGVKLRVEHAESEQGVSYYLENQGDDVNSNAISDTLGDFGFALYHNQTVDISVNPPELSGFAITNVEHEINQDTSEHIFLQHFDANAPQIITGPWIRQITQTTAVVEWLTDKPATSVAVVSNGLQVQSLTLTTHHSLVLSGLTPQTQYSVDVHSVDKESRSSNVETATFTTLAEPEVFPPVFEEGPVVDGITDTEFWVVFCADKPVTANVTIDETVYVINDLNVCHELLIENLTPETAYQVSVDITDADGNDPTVSQPIIATTLPTPDIQPPQILLNPMVIDISATEATVIWNTDELANSGVSYNDTANFHVVTDPSFVKEHAMQLTDLTPETTYYLTVSSTDVHGNGPTLSEQISFTTLALPDTTAPCLVGVPLIQNITHQNVVIRWWNCEPAASYVKIGTSPTELDRNEHKNGYKTFHNIAITRLEADTNYYFRIVNTDAAGNVFESETFEFKTKVVGHQGDPYFDSEVVVSDLTSHSATFSWQTDVNAMGRIVCVSATETRETSGSKYSKKHGLTLTNLSAATDYACTAYATDRKGYTAERIVLDAVARLSESSTKTSLKAVPVLSSEPVFNAYGTAATLEINIDQLSSVLVKYRQASANSWQQTGYLDVASEHVIYLADLTESTDYEVELEISNLAGEVFISSGHSFNSGSLSSLVAPSITNAAIVSSITTENALVSVATQDLSFVQISYGTQVEQLTDKEANVGLANNHNVLMARLSPATIYYAKVTAYNIAGDSIEGDVFSFTTSALNDVIDSDLDGITDVWEILNNLDPQNALDASEDSDNDGLTNLEEFEANSNPFDPDSDNDGMPDGWEVDHGLDPNDASDADSDRDGNGESNLDEYLNAIDTTAPVISLSELATINATGLLTPITNTGVTVSDDQDSSVTVSIVGALARASGSHVVYWQAEDSAGNKALASQIVNINPILMIKEKQYVAEGNSVELNFELLGDAPVYPVDIALSYSGDVSAEDFENAPASLSIESGRAGSIRFDVLADSTVEGEESLVVNLDSLTNATFGLFASHEMIITESNLPANLQLAMTQNGLPVSTATRDGGNVEVTLTIVDPNGEDTHNVNWGLTDELITDLDSEALTLTFDPAQLTQRVYAIGATVSDSGTPVESAAITASLKVIDTAPELLASEDSDGDGISDLDEGFQDSDGDGVADYLDSTSVSNLIQLVEETSNNDGTFWMESEPGLSIALGNVALNNGNGVASVDEDDLASVAPYDTLGDDEGFDIIADLFDFVITGLARAGESVQVVIPQTSQIPANASYRKLHPVNGWQGFVVNNRNAIYSAAGSEGACPSPGDSAYSAGLTEGHWCIMLEIEDGGANDGDQQVNGSIVDPGGLAIANPAPVVTIPSIAQLTAGDSISLNASVNNNGNQISSYQWTQVSGPSVTINNANQLNASVSNAGQGNYEFSLTVIDQHNRSVSASVSVVVAAASQPEPPPVNDSGGGGGSLPVAWLLLLLMASVLSTRKKGLN